MGDIPGQPNATCEADITIKSGFYFPLRAVRGGGLEYQASGVIEQVGFDAPILSFSRGNLTITWKSPCGSSNHPTSVDFTLIDPVFQNVLASVGFPGTALSDALPESLGSRIANALSLHFYTWSVPGPADPEFDNLVITTQGSRVSVHQAGNLVNSESTAPSNGQFGTAHSTATSPNWSAPASGTTGAFGAPVNSALRSPLQQHPLAPSAAPGAQPALAPGTPLGGHF